MDMVISQRHARTEGMDGATWVDAVAWPRWGELNEVTIAEVVSEAEENAAIVPAELVEATSEAAIILQDAKQLRQQGQGVMDAIITGIAMEYEQTDELGEMTDEQLIALDEMQRIAKEQQIRAKVRAEFNAKQAQVKANNLQQRSDQLKGKGA